MLFSQWLVGSTAHWFNQQPRNKFRFGFIVYDHNLCWLLNAKAILDEELGGDKGVHAFPKSKSERNSVIGVRTRLYNVAVHHVEW